MNVSCKCEHEFWKHSPNVVDEPVAAASGLLMCLLPLFDSAGLSDPPLQFCLARASLVFCGLGTFVFHALSDEQMDQYHLNGIIFDGVSMAVVTVNVFLLHLSESMKRYPMVVSLCSICYLFFWIITNDLATFRYLQSATKVNGVELFSIAVQYPSFVLVYVYILLKIAFQGCSICQCCYRGSSGSVLNNLARHWPMWTALLVSVVAWALNQFACTLWTGFFVGHTVWHIGIGYVAHYLIVLGVAGTYGYRQRRRGVLVRLELDVEVEKGYGGEFGAEFHFDKRWKLIKELL